MAKRKLGLRLHARGMYYIKVDGKFYYFGKDREAAEARWQAEGPYILKGLPVPEKTSGQRSLGELISKYLAYCEDQERLGSIGIRHLNGIRATLGRVMGQMGEDAIPSQWTPATFQDIKAKLSLPVVRTPRNGRHKGLVGKEVKSRQAGTIAGDIRRIKAFLNWASGDDHQLIPRPQFGKTFTVPRKVLRRLKAAKGRQDMPAADIRKVLDVCSIQFKPIVLLGINAGMGAKDISNIQLQDYLGVESIWSIARGKTGSDRKFWLWPETIQAINDYLAYRRRLRAKDRAPCKRPEWEPLLFRTAQGNAWLTESENKCKDSIGWYFGRLARRVKVRGKFYDLRRTFETIAGEKLDQMAVDVVMGHVPNADNMASVYVQNIGNDRIKSVCNHVRSWLYG